MEDLGENGSTLFKIHLKEIYYGLFKDAISNSAV
jgi:hypothetical protein